MDDQQLNPLTAIRAYIRTPMDPMESNGWVQIQRKNAAAATIQAMKRGASGRLQLQAIKAHVEAQTETAQQLQSDAAKKLQAFARGIADRSWFKRSSEKAQAIVRDISSDGAKVQPSNAETSTRKLADAIFKCLVGEAPCARAERDETELARVATEFRRVQGELRRVQKDADSLRQDLKLKGAETDSLRRQLEFVSHELQSKITENHELETHLRAVRRAAEAKAHERAHGHHRSPSYEPAKGSSEGKQKAELEVAKERQAAAEATAMRLQRELVEVQAELTKAKSEEITKAPATVGSSKLPVVSLRDSDTDEMAEERTKEMAEERAKLQVECSKLQRQIQRIESERDQKVERLEAEKAQAQAAAAKALEATEMFRAQLKAGNQFSWRSQLAERDKEIQSSRATIEGLRSQLQATERKAELRRTTVSQLEEQLRAAEEVGRFHSQLVHQLENQLEQQKKIVSERGTL
jgi:chromosome segregation ATPase